MYYLESGHENARFRNAVWLALAVHAALILAISFKSSTAPRSSTSQIEVTLATRPSAAAPENAPNIAQANQEGSGDEAQIDQISSPVNLPINVPSVEQSVMPAPQEQAALQRETLTTTARSPRTVTSQQTEQQREASDLQGINPEVNQPSQELTGLQAELDDQTRMYARQPRVRRLTAASAKQSADAAYLLDWRQRLEAVGNQYYPQASVRYGMYGDLRMLVVIRHDGTLEDIQILSSSGFAVLDEAAIKIVRMAAPFSPFPPALRATTDKLEIVRTWHFQKNELSSP
jgi:protein TonB